MSWLVLTFVACLSVQGEERCQTVELPFEGTPQQCLLRGSDAIVDWARRWGYAGKVRYPKGYRCASGRPT